MLPLWQMHVAHVHLSCTTIVASLLLPAEHMLAPLVSPLLCVLTPPFEHGCYAFAADPSAPEPAFAPMSGPALAPGPAPGPGPSSEASAQAGAPAPTLPTPTGRRLLAQPSEQGSWALLHRHPHRQLLVICCLSAQTCAQIIACELLPLCPDLLALWPCFFCRCCGQQAGGSILQLCCWFALLGFSWWRLYESCFESELHTFTMAVRETKHSVAIQTCI